MVEPQQGLSYAELLALARHAEAAGFEAFFRSDHYASFPGPFGKPTTDAWATLAGLARETDRIRLGTLVSPVTFRHPGELAKVVATVDEMSGGRVELGVGVGWNEDEHRQHGLPYPPMDERFAMLEEELEILHGFWREPDGWSFAGAHWRVESAVCHPKPIQRPHPPIIVGGEGRPRSARLAARWADEYNLNGIDPPETARRVEALRRACAAEGRDPDALVYSMMAGVVVGSSEAELRARVAEMLRLFELPADEAERWIEARRGRYVIGTPEQALERIAAYAAAGISRMQLQCWLPRDLEMVSLMGREIVARA